jgi:hypothetical protein
MKKLVLSLAMLFAGSIGAAKPPPENPNTKIVFQTFFGIGFEHIIVEIPRKTLENQNSKWGIIYEAAKNGLANKGLAVLDFRLVHMGRKVQPEDYITDQDRWDFARNHGLMILPPSVARPAAVLERRVPQVARPVAPAEASEEARASGYVFWVRTLAGYFQEYFK